MFKALQNIPIPLLLLVATTLEVGGDATVRLAIYQHAGLTRIALLLGGAAAVGLVTVRRHGNQKHFQANAVSPVFGELRGIVRKTFGLADILRSALSPLAPKIRAAFVYGSVAKGHDTATSDIDLMVVSDSLSYGEVFSALEQASREMLVARRIPLCTHHASSTDVSRTARLS